MYYWIFGETKSKEAAMRRRTLRERRLAHRVITPQAQAFCCNDYHSGYYEVADLSCSGALLTNGALLSLGTHLDLILTGPHLGVIEVRGEVVRAEAGAFAVEFIGLQRYCEDRVESLVSLAKR